MGERSYGIWCSEIERFGAGEWLEWPIRDYDDLIGYCTYRDMLSNEIQGSLCLSLLLLNQTSVTRRFDGKQFQDFTSINKICKDDLWG